MDIGKVSNGEKLAAGGGILAFVGLLFKWYGLSLGALGAYLNTAGYSTSISGWHGSTMLRWLILIMLIAAVGLAVMKAYGQSLELPISPSVIVTGLGGLSLLFVLYRVVSPPSHTSVKFGIFISLVGAAVTTFGGWQSMQESGASFGEVRDRAESMMKDVGTPSGGGGAPSGGGGTPPPAPPAGGAPAGEGSGSGFGSWGGGDAPAPPAAPTAPPPPPVRPIPTEPEPGEGSGPGGGE